MGGLTYDGIPSTEIDSTNFSGTTIQASTLIGANISGTTALRAATVIGGTAVSGVTLFSSSSISGINLNLTGSALDGQGRLRSTVLGSATTGVFGGWVQVGSASTSAGSVGFAAFGQPTSDSNYYLLFSPRGFVAGGGSVVPFESGTRSTSGVSFIGAASQAYTFAAIGT